MIFEPLTGFPLIIINWQNYYRTIERISVLSNQHESQYSIQKFIAYISDKDGLKYYFHLTGFVFQ